MIRSRVLRLGWCFPLIVVGAACSIGEGRGTILPAEPSTFIRDRVPDDRIFDWLLAREIGLPGLRPNGQCPLSGAIALRGIPAEAGLGPGTRNVQKLDAGPVYLVQQGIPRIMALLPPTNDGWRSTRVLIVSKPEYRGPILIRGRQMDGPHPVRFDVASRRERELRLPSGPWDEGNAPLLVWEREVRPPLAWRVAVIDVLIRAHCCYGLQIDGLSFGYPISFFAAWHEP
jgi:hypothetical protein